ncbi:lipopolysaccharide heptosyltransferase [Alkalilimnicola ehrlichii]|uniref:Lipopolysaccharide heptosyltransferase n=1 Tax=Alkalilimnicola ehrlichii TaxID=351052 RepID=A0A3E0WWZ2_9GAMM|nr:glycosyltransferase family 9 protein [Alkalilimnicola ehrlichii]RFA30176.1 lipopolysaccharide heptosyltransferase [Alkalilimnicola ehrlichii]RFA37524.1 lipopolysaccharide heptosyltransferase [Alkalilimnicola ehrlichii]
MERILLIRLSAIGDIVFASGLPGALKARWPQAHISWLTEPATVGLLEAHPDVDEVIPWPRADWRALAKRRRYLALGLAIRRFATDLRARRFDLAIDAQGLLKSAAFARMSGAPTRVGVNCREGGQWLVTDNVRSPTDDRRISSEYRDLATHFGANEADFRLQLAVPPAARSAAAEAVGEQAGDYVALCPFTTRPQKHWLEERWHALAETLQQRLALTPVWLGGPDDREAAARFAAPGVDLTGRLTLPESAAVIAGARLVIGVDTGLTHMGVAADVPTLALFGSTRPYLDTGRRNACVLYRELSCSPCRRRPTCNGAFTCMREHSVAEVASHAQRLLEVAA